jgi:hypothetical protein
VDGSEWLVYVEGLPTDRPAGWRSQTRLPQRRLRFDSLIGSRVIAAVPPGAPFLPPQTLQTLFESARAVER